MLNPLRPLPWLGFCCALVSCSGEADGADGGESDSAELARGPGAFDLEFASSDDFFTRMSAPAVGLDSSPHGKVQIYYSKNLEAAVGLKEFVAPEGSVAIKTQDFDDSGDYGEILVMIKEAAGFNKEAMDWRFEVRRADGAVKLEGTEDTEFCANCHRAFESVDGLAGIELEN